MQVAKAFGRKHDPLARFVDEATSALDKAAASTLYGRLKNREEASNGALVPTGHRPSASGRSLP